MTSDTRQVGVKDRCFVTRRPLKQLGVNNLHPCGCVSFIAIFEEETNQRVLHLEWEDLGETGSRWGLGVGNGVRGGK